MLHLHPSNQTESLAAVLLGHLAEANAGASSSTPARSVFEPDTVLVPHAGMRRWLSLRMADAFGICAQVEFGFLAQWLWQQIGRAEPARLAGSPSASASPSASPLQSPLSSERLVWRIHAALGDAAFIADHPRLAAYLRAADPVMRLELAQRVARTLDQTVTYRPDWLTAWQARRNVLPAVQGEPDADEAWQAALWRRITDELRIDGRHPAEAYVDALQRRGGTGLPHAVHVFGLPAVAPQHAGLLLQMSRWCEVHVYLLNPCREFWSDVVDRRQLARLAAQGQLDLQTDGNRLLASWGRQTQALVDTWQQIPDSDAPTADGQTPIESVTHEHFTEPAGPSLLAQVQRSVLDLEPIEPGGWSLDHDDRSIEIHVAHSLTRELEALHDRLCGLFANDPTLRPDDVLVVTPDLPAAAPLIHAVFGTVLRERLLPYAITGLGRSRENPCAKLLLDLMALLRSRAGATQLLAWCRQDLVARRFGLDTAELDELQSWLVDAGLRWGWDAAHRRELGLADGPHHAAAHTLDDALDRLLRGLAIPSVVWIDEVEAAGGALVDGLVDGMPDVLPVDAAEGQSAQILGRFAALVARLRPLQPAWSTPATARDWQARIVDVMDRLTEPQGSESDDLRELLSQLADLVDAIDAAAPSERLPLSVLQAALVRALDDPAHGGVPTGAITFSAMASLRGLPFRVVCAVGLNDGAFPGRDAVPEFDLLSRAPRRGDRQRRQDDRNVFLDLMLSARERWLLSYTGRSVHDNSSRPASVLVSELLDALRTGVGGSVEGLVVNHPLLDWPALLAGGGAMATAAATPPSPVAAATTADATTGSDDRDDDDDANEASHSPPSPFFIGALPAPDPIESLDLDSLIRFWRHPCRTLLRQRLRVDLSTEDNLLSDDETLVPDRDIERDLAQRWLPWLLDDRRVGRDGGGGSASGDRDIASALQARCQTLRRLVRADTGWPTGSLGDLTLDREIVDLRDFALAVDAARSAPLAGGRYTRVEPYTASLQLQVRGAACTVTHRFGDAGELIASPNPSLVRWRRGPLSGGDVIELWILHLLLCSAPPPAWTACEHGPAAVWVARDRTLRWPAVRDAASQLAGLVDGMQQGLCEPLPFFARASWARACRLDGASGIEDGSLGRARAIWVGAPGSWSDRDDPWHRLAFRHHPEPLNDDFEHWAERVFGPVREHLRQAQTAGAGAGAGAGAATASTGP